MLSNCGAGKDSWESLGESLKEIQAVNPKGNQSWIFIGRTDVETEAPILCSLDDKTRLIGKYPDSGQDWRQKEKGSVEGEMVKQHYHLMDMNLSILQEIVEDRGALHTAIHVRKKLYTT